MTLPWYLTVIGLYLSTTAAWFMYRYPMAAARYGDAMAPGADASAEALRAFTRHRRCAHLGGLFLIAGFLLQFFGVLLAGLSR